MSFNLIHIGLESSTILLSQLTDPEVALFTFNGSIVTGVIVVGFLLFLSFMCSISEIAFFSLRPEEIENIKSRGTGISRRAIKLYDSPDRLVNTLDVIKLIANTVLVLFSFSLLNMLTESWENMSLQRFIYAVSIILALLVFGEFMPRVYSPKRNIGTVLLMAYPLTLFELVLRPITAIMTYSSSIMKKKVGFYKPSIIDELSDVLEQTNVNLNEDEKILKGVVNFSNINVNAIMCPRIDVTAIDISDNFREVVPVIIESGFSRIPVYSESFDNIKGILYAKDILPYMEKPADFKWQELLREPYFVPETKKINLLLKELQVNKMHMAIVIDEYGGTSGIVTLEDILEEIVGEITDESDEDEISYRKIDENTFLFKGKVLLDDFLEILGLDHDPFIEIRGQSETLAGLVLELTGEIPKVKQTVNFKNYQFIVESADKRRITSIRFKILVDNNSKNAN